MFSMWDSQISMGIHPDPSSRNTSISLNFLWGLSTIRWSFKRKILPWTVTTSHALEVLSTSNTLIFATWGSVGVWCWNEYLLLWSTNVSHVIDDNFIFRLSVGKVSELNRSVSFLTLRSFNGGYRAGPRCSLLLFGVERCSNPEYFPSFFWVGIGHGHIRWWFLQPRRPLAGKSLPKLSHFCLDNVRLIDVAEDCLSAEVVEEIFFGNSVQFLELLEWFGVVPFWLGIANWTWRTSVGEWLDMFSNML